MRFLPVILALALVVYALVDCVRSDDSDMPVGLPKAVWVILIIVFPGVGAIAWLVVSRVARQGQRTPGRPLFGGGQSHPSASRRAAPRPLAPDDDPDFLASLGRQEPELPTEPEAPTGEDAPEPDAGPQDENPTPRS